MKITTATLALLLSGIQLCSAQKNAFFLAENNLSGYHSTLLTKTSSSSYTEKSTNKFITVVPMLGYYRFPVSDVGYGVELGYNSTPRSSERSTDYETGSISHEQFLTKAKTMHLNLNIMERFHYKKYMLTASLTVPMAWTFRNDGSGTYKTIDNINQQVTYEGVSKNQEPKSFKSGLYLKGGIHHLIIKKVYVGAFIHLGILGEKYYGKRGEERTSTTNIPNYSDSRYELEYKKYIRVYNDISTSLCLSYFF